MKMKAWTTAALLAGLTASAGLALAIPNDQKPPQPPAGVQNAQAPAEELPGYLGVAVQRVDADTAKLLTLKPGTGLSISQVAEDGPAKAAGLQRGDVVTRLNDQLLVNEEQLAVLIRMHKAGDTVTLHVLRNGEEIRLKAELAGRAAPQARQEKVPLGIAGDRAIPGDPFEMIERMRRQMEQHRLDMDRMMRQMRIEIGPDALLVPPAGAAQVRSQISVDDGEHRIQLQTNNDARHLKVTTTDGEVIYDGELDKDGRAQGLPEDVQRKVDEILKNHRIRFRVPPPAVGDDGPIA